MINKTEYAWENLNAVALGRSIDGIRGVEYEKPKEFEHLYGRGSKPRGIQGGNEEPKGVLTILQSELEALIRASNNQGVTEIPPFDLTVAYATATDTTPTVDICKGVQLMNTKKALAQNDKHMVCEVPFICLDIEFNV